jgi:hypothetical protein
MIRGLIEAAVSSDVDLSGASSAEGLVKLLTPGYGDEAESLPVIRER